MMSFLLIVLQALYLFAPAYAANMAPVVAQKGNLPGGRPISAALLGAHKTWRGVYSAYLGAFVTLVIQQWMQFHGELEIFRVLPYDAWSPFVLALPFGIGAIAGDAVKSFVKRRLGIAPGSAWPPFDQLDFVIGALVCLLPFVQIPLPHLLVILLLTPLLHATVNVISFWCGFKSVWW